MSLVAPRAPRPLSTDDDDTRRVHEDLATLSLDDLEHEAAIAVVALGLDERRRDPERTWWLARVRAARAELRSRR